MKLLCEDLLSCEVLAELLFLLMEVRELLSTQLSHQISCSSWAISPVRAGHILWSVGGSCSHNCSSRMAQTMRLLCGEADLQDLWWDQGEISGPVGKAGVCGLYLFDSQMLF